MWFQNLNSFAHNIQSKYILLFILILGFLLRVNRLTMGFPMLYVSQDEAIYHLSALNMLAHFTPFTIGNYGPLGAYMQFPFLALASAMLFFQGNVHNFSDIQFLLLTQEGYMLFIPRFVSAMFGVLSILATFWLARDLFHKKAIALWAAFLAATSFNLVHISHLARGWSPAIFFALIAAKFAVNSVSNDRDEFKNTIFAFVSTAVAFGFHQLSGIIILLVVLIRVFARQFKKNNILSKPNFYGLLIFILLIFVFNSLSLGKDFLNIISPQNKGVNLITIPTGTASGFLKYFLDRGTFTKFPHDLILSDGIIFFLAVVFFLKRKITRIYKPFLIFLVINTILFAIILPILLRYYLLSIMFFPIFGAVTLWTLMKRRYGLILVLFFIFATSFNSIWWNILISKRTTFEETRDWLAANVPVRTPIATMGIRTLGYAPSRDAADVIRKTHPGYYRTSSSLIGDSYPPNVRNVIYMGQLGGKSESENLRAALEVYPIKYVVNSYLNSNQRLINEKSNVKLRLVAHFSPTGEIIYDKDIPAILIDAGNAVPLTRVNRAGPYIDVLEIY